MAWIDLVQNTSEWWAWRGRGVGSADVAALLGQNPFETRSAFRERWLRGLPRPRGESQSADQLRGQVVEPLARIKLGEREGETFEPRCAEWDEDTFLHASVDGYSRSSNLICEIKAPRGFRALTLQNHLQIQTQLLVTKAVGCHFCQAVRTEGQLQLRVERVEPDPRTWRQITGAVAQFKAEVLSTKT